MLAAGDVLLGLQIAIAIMVIVLLYHALFIAVDLRKVLRRIEEITAQLEDVILKPISLIDHVFQLIIEILEKQGKGKRHPKLKDKTHRNTT